MDKLTVEKLKQTGSGKIFASGVDVIEAFWDKGDSREVRWVAKRGGVYDWAIYYIETSIPSSDVSIASYGNKMKNKADIMKVMPCDKAAFGRYRW